MTLPAGISLRDAASGDDAFLRALYRSVRDPELALTAWSEAQKDAFANQQFDLQDRSYRGNYPGARFLVVEREGAPIGRLYLYEGGGELHVLDIALVAAERKRGLGTSLMEWIQRSAAARSAAVTLHVAMFNPARKLYARLGFRDESVDGVYAKMRWAPSVRAG
jgi:ribosomal protein S18 acetylase RimI-like enzyme